MSLLDPEIVMIEKLLDRQSAILHQQEKDINSIRNIIAWKKETPAWKGDRIIDSLIGYNENKGP